MFGSKVLSRRGVGLGPDYTVMGTMDKIPLSLVLSVSGSLSPVLRQMATRFYLADWRVVIAESDMAGSDYELDKIVLATS
jgi:hypothetical protein